ALRTVDPARRAQAYAEVMGAIDARIPWVPLLGQAGLVVAKPGLSGLTLGGADEVLLYGAYWQPSR
ncbi:MAG TPA: hypothetical protein VGL40_14680, partial [Bacillota bacterium]